MPIHNLTHRVVERPAMQRVCIPIRQPQKSGVMRSADARDGSQFHRGKAPRRAALSRVWHFNKRLRFEPDGCERNDIGQEVRLRGITIARC